MVLDSYSTSNTLHELLDLGPLRARYTHVLVFLPCCRTQEFTLPLDNTATTRLQWRLDEEFNACEGLDSMTLDAPVGGRGVEACHPQGTCCPLIRDP